MSPCHPCHPCHPYQRRHTQLPFQKPHSLLSLVTYSFQHSCPAHAAKDIKVFQNQTRVGWDAFEDGGYFRGRAPLLEQPAPFPSDTWVGPSRNNQQVIRNQTRLTWQSWPRETTNKF